MAATEKPAAAIDIFIKGGLLWHCLRKRLLLP